MENVKNLVSKRFKLLFDEWVNYLSSLGYKFFYKILNARDYGIPQNRERVFMVSILDCTADYEFPQKQLYVNNECDADNIYCHFMHKYLELADEILCVIPKTFLMIPDANEVREQYQKEFRVVSIYDYGVNFFKEVFIEIISIHFTRQSIKETYIENIKESIRKKVIFDYIYHDKMWLAYKQDVIIKVNL